MWLFGLMILLMSVGIYLSPTDENEKWLKIFKRKY